MPVIAYRKKVVRRRRRRMIPHRRIFRTKSLIPKRTIYIHKGRFRLFKHRTERERIFRRFNTFVLPTGKRRSYSNTTKKTQALKKKKDWSIEKGQWTKLWKSEQWKSYATEERGKLGESQKKALDRERRKVGTKKKLKKTFKKVENRGGKREYTWKGKYYGEMKALGPKLICEIIPTRDLRLYSKLRKKMQDHATVMANTKAAMQKMLDGLKIYNAFLVSKYVPKETGDLRKAMIKSIDDTKIHALRMKIQLSTGDITYANPVNNMPQEKIRHKAWRKQIGRRSGRILVDPKAVSGWFDFISMLLNTKAKELIKVMVEDMMTAWIYREKPSGWIHPPVATKVIKVESEAAYKNRQASYEARGSEYKRIGKMRKRGTVKMTKEIPVRRNKEKEVQVGRDDRKRTLREMRERKYKKQKQLDNAQLWGKKAVVVEYPKWLIKDFFKIRGLNKK